MHRVCIPTGVKAGERILLPKPEAHYVANVLRLRSGDEVQALDGAGHAFRLRLLTVSSAAVEGELVTTLTSREDEGVQLVLGQGVPKGPKMDLIVEKCSELGLTTLIPVYTERTVGRDTARAAAKLPRWRRVAAAAARQCGRQVFLEVQAPVSLRDFCVTYEAAPVKIVCWEEEQKQGLRQVLERGTGQSPVVILIGPEGGLTPEEVALAQSHGFLAVSLGWCLLRTETAAIAVTSIIRYSSGALEPQRESSGGKHHDEGASGW
jgi:16S rRNA (uracil1498-N3)-methyltransferase